MKSIKWIPFVLIFFLFTSCAIFTRHVDVVEQNTFWATLPMMNNEILGALQYDDANLNLQSIEIKNYPDLFSMIELTKDYQNALEFIQHHAKIEKFIVLPDTFIVCICSEDHDFSLCDDASTSNSAPDKVREGKCFPAIDELYQDVVNVVNQK